MKLIRLKINSRFRSLHPGFEIVFRSSFDDEEEDLSQFNPFCLVGLNGSGKSNILEALAEIFYHINSCSLKYKPEKFKDSFDPSSSKIDSFELEYFIGLNNQKSYTLPNLYRIRIVKSENEAPEMWVKNYPFSEEEDDLQVATISNDYESAASKIYLPDLVVAYSSGENEILSLPFIKTKFLHYDEYLEALEKGYKYEAPESGMIYIDNGMSQAVLLTNLLFQDETTLKPLKDALGIVAMRSFRINLNIHKIRASEKEGNTSISILDQLENKVQSLKKCSTSWFSYSDRNLEEHLVLDFWVDDATKLAFKDHFLEAFNLFRLFQILYVLNNRIVTKEIKEEVYQSKGYYLDGKIPYPAPAEHVFYFLDFLILKKDKGETSSKELLLRNFSDGEHQFLHTIGICLMLKNHRTLLLLDEPETHFNPNWRSKFVKILRDSIKAGGGNNMLKDIILTSHSPFVISDSQPQYVYIFNKNKIGEAVVRTAADVGINTFGTSVNLISMKIFGKTETIADLPNDVISNIKNKLDKDTISKSEAIEMTEFLGESVEKTLLIHSINRK